MEGMKSIRKSTKLDILFNLFDEIGKKMSVKDTCSITGIPNYNTLKADLSYLRRSKHIPDENRVDIRIMDDMCIRVN